MQSRLICLLAVTVPVLCAPAAHAQPYTPDARTLLLDHMDETFTPDGTQRTRPARITASGELTGGLPMGGTGAAFVPGKFGNALQMRGLMQMTYPSTGNIDVSAGQAEFWVAFDFDAAEVIKNPGNLSNQVFLTVWGPGASHACLYSCLSVVCVGVFDASRQLVCYANVPGSWRKGEWHHVVLKWGLALELSVDDQKAQPQDWTGLFGPMDVKPDDLKLTFGSPVGWSTVESEYAVDELRPRRRAASGQPDDNRMPPQDAADRRWEAGRRGVGRRGSDHWVRWAE